MSYQRRGSRPGKQVAKPKHRNSCELEWGGARARRYADLKSFFEE